MIRFSANTLPRPLRPGSAESLSPRFLDEGRNPVSAQ
jgi:hypothetical protein